MVRRREPPDRPQCGATPCPPPGRDQQDSQQAAWQKAIAVFDEADGQTRQGALFPEDRQPPATDLPAVQVRLDHLQLSRPRTWGACWLGDQLWGDLQLDTVFAPRLGGQS